MKAKQNVFKIFIIIVAALLTVGAVGATVAYITNKTPPIENEFTPTVVSCEITETFDGENKTDVAVKNTGNVTAYVRAVVVVCWVSEEDGSIYSEMPKEGVDYSLTQSLTGWAKSTDGYYYYVTPLAPGASTDALISSLTSEPTAPDGYTLSVQIAASALQSTPKETVEKLWHVTVLDTGSLSLGE